MPPVGPETTSRNLAAAQALADAGCPVFPWDPESEQPAVAWAEQSTTDSAEVERLWRQHPDALPAIDLGKAGLVVIELTYAGGRPGFESYTKIARAFGWDVEPPGVLCPCGVHLYLRPPAGAPIGACERGLDGYGITVHGQGGYVIGLGAVLDGFEWIQIKPPRLLDALARDDLPVVPDWLVELVRHTPADGERKSLAELLSAVQAQTGYRKQAAAIDAASWRRPDLSCLGRERAPVPPFPLDALGDFWGSWCAAHAQARNAPVDYVAGTLLAASAALIGNRRWPHASDDWREPPVLWLALVGAPSSGKSPAQQPVLDLLRSIERDAKTRLLVSGTTPAAVGPLLQKHPDGLLLHRGDLASWLGIFSGYAGVAGGEREMWLASYRGRSHSIDRVRQPQPIHIPHLTIGILGSIGSDDLAMLLDGRAETLAARFLWCWPAPVTGFTLRRASIDSTQQLDAFRRIVALKMTAVENGDRTPGRVDLSDTAAADFEAFVRRMKERAAASLAGTGAVLGEAGGHCLRLAMTLCCLDWSARSSDNEPRAIEREHVERAVRLIESYFLPMGRRAFGEAALSAHDLCVMTLARWLRENRTPVFNARAARYQIAGKLREPATMERACATLVEAGLIRPLPSRSGGTKGRMRSDYEVNPAIRA